MIDLKPDIDRLCRLTKRQLGKILVDGKFISSEDLDLALNEQNRTNELLGEVLVRMGLLDAPDLRAALSVQGELASLETAVRAAAGVRQLLGALLIQASRITPEQLDLALKEQRGTGEKLGEVLVRLSFLTEGELNAVLAFQRNYHGDRANVPVAFRLGEILIASNYITREQLEEALNRQRQTEQRLGEILVEAGYIQPQHVEHGLALQKMLLTAALVAALSFSSMPGFRSPDVADAASSSGKMNVTATVLPRTSVKVLSQLRELVITNSDVARGYVEVRAASRLEVMSNSQGGFLLAFEGLCAPFREVYVQGFGKEMQINSSWALIPQPNTKGLVTMELSYRFMLAGSTEPGTYAWPLSISAQPL